MPRDRRVENIIENERFWLRPLEVPDKENSNQTIVIRKEWNALNEIPKAIS